MGTDMVIDSCSMTSDENLGASARSTPASHFAVGPCEAAFDGKFQTLGSAMPDSVALPGASPAELGKTDHASASVPPNHDMVLRPCTAIVNTSSFEPASASADALQVKEFWLLPLDDRRGNGGHRPGLMAGCTLLHYLKVIDWASRLNRPGKAAVDADVRSILERLRVDSSVWIDTMSRLVAEPERIGCYFGSPACVAEAARAHGRRWLRNQIRREPIREAPTAA